MALQDKLNECGEWRWGAAAAWACAVRVLCNCLILHHATSSLPHCLLYIILRGPVDLHITPPPATTLHGATSTSHPPTADRKGASNAALPRDEDREAFAAISASCSTRAEAEDLLAEIVNAK